MPRTAVSIQQLNGPYDTDGHDLSLVAGDVANGNAFPATGKEIVIVRNTGASAYLATVQSVADPQGRTGNISKSIAAGGFWVWEASNLVGFQQSDGNIYLDLANAALTVAVLRLSK